MGKFTNKDIRKRKTKNLDLNYAVFGNPSSFIQEKGIWANIKNWYPTKGDYIYFVVFEYDSWGGKDINVPLVTTLNSQGKSSIPVAISTYNSIFVDGYIKIVPNNSITNIAINSTRFVSVNNDQIEFKGSWKP